MKTVSVDKYQRIRLPDVKGGQKFAYENMGNGVLMLTELKPVEQSNKGRLEKHGKRLLGVTDKPITSEMVKQALGDFP